MSAGFVPQAEFEMIRRSWRGAEKAPWKTWTSEQHLEACYLNVQEAAKREATLRAHDQAWPIGDQRRNGDATTPSLRERIRVAVSDQKHWREYVGHWRAKCVVEFEHKSAGYERAQQPDSRLPRERDDEEGLPW